jgi:FlaA1/EpsC-like NDP-sugar epimerase
MRNRYILLLDLPLFALAAYAAFLLRFDWFFPQHRPEFLPYLTAALVIKPVLFLLLGMYGRVWRYASVRDLGGVLFAVSVCSIAMGIYVAIGTMTGRFPEFSRSVIFIDWMLTLSLAGGLRMSVRLFHEGHLWPVSRQKGDGKRVLVAGAGDAGSIVVREMRRNPQLGMVPVAFLDDNRLKAGKRMLGLPIMGPLSELGAAVDRHRIDDVVIAMPTAPGSIVRALTDASRLAGVTSRIVPGVFELLEGQLTVSRLREVEIADLLRREHLAGRPEAAMYLAQKCVLVTGAGGSIGSELCRQIALANPSLLVLLGHGENSLFEAAAKLAEHFPRLQAQTVVADIRDRHRIAECFRRVRPDVVFHAAAHKHVPLMEENPEEAITNNALGTKNVVDAAIDTGVERLVLISTDKAVAPSCMMGASKRLAEIIVRDGARRSGRAFSVVRFGNVLGSRGSVIPTFKRQIESGGPITITHPDMKRFFMTIPEAVHLVLQAGGLSKGGELFVLNMGEAVTIVQLAEDLIRLSGLTPLDVPIVFTGVRPGEKLEELLWENGATVDPTAHPAVLSVKESEPMNAAEVAYAIQVLAEEAASGGALRIEGAMAHWLPSYVPFSVHKHLAQ